jgi:hypothetical protein
MTPRPDSSESEAPLGPFPSCRSGGADPCEACEAEYVRFLTLILLACFAAVRLVLAIYLLSFVQRRDESKSNVQFTQIGAHRRFYNN